MIGSRKEEGRVCSTFYDLSDSISDKSQVRPKIRTRLARTECHCSTACATTAAQLAYLMIAKPFLNQLISRSPVSLARLCGSRLFVAKLKDFR